MTHTRKARPLGEGVGRREANPKRQEPNSKAVYKGVRRVRMRAVRLENRDMNQAMGVDEVDG